MCLIICKKCGHRVDQGIIEKAWETNPDGAGIAIYSAGVWNIRKGLMTLESLMDALPKKQEDHSIIIHLRIATSGIVSAGLTHPFPLSEPGKLLSTTTQAKTVMAHNGIINLGYPSEEQLMTYSDTYLLCRDILTGIPERDDKILHYASASGSGKFCYAHGARVKLYGKWEYEDGIAYSNMYWKRPRFSWTYNYRYWNGAITKCDICKGAKGKLYSLDSYHDDFTYRVCLSCAESLGQRCADCGNNYVITDDSHICFECFGYAALEPTG